jgi:mannose-6-phosphate isomerase-like protein (cupin superfamily)
MLMLIFLLLFAGTARPVPQASNSNSLSTVVTAGEISAALKNGKQNPKSVPGTIDETVRAFDAGNSHVGVAITHRTEAETHDAVVHENVTEIYHITEGSGTLELGGTLVAGKPFGPNTGNPYIGPSLRGTGIQGGHSQHVAAGDVVIIPPGTPHRFTAIDGPITYMVFRVDTTKTTPLK